MKVITQIIYKKLIEVDINAPDLMYFEDPSLCSGCPKGENVSPDWGHPEQRSEERDLHHALKIRSLNH